MQTALIAPLDHLTGNTHDESGWEIYIIYTLTYTQTSMDFSLGPEGTDLSLLMMTEPERWIDCGGKG